ncbi:hypothetical protein BC835DRAFT_1032786 [Cytidiella melzeri]|nr:hypothetical protein BC835DRAFT_1032786 [Cytidiella melzeri]
MFSRLGPCSASLVVTTRQRQRNLSRSPMSQSQNLSSDGMHELTDNLKFWTNELFISSRFFFDKIRARVITKLNSLPSLKPVERLCFAKKHDMPDWLRPAYHSICRRPEPLKVSEAQKIGWDTAILPANAGEILQDTRQIGPPETPPGPVLFGPPQYGDRRVS